MIDASNPSVLIYGMCVHPGNPAGYAMVLERGAAYPTACYVVPASRPTLPVKCSTKAEYLTPLIVHDPVFIFSSGKGCFHPKANKAAEKYMEWNTIKVERDIP